MNTKSLECWASDPQTRGLRIEISAEDSLLLPHDQFVFAELKSEGREQQLRLIFATHQVSVRGYSLRRIEIAMQRAELSMIAKLSAGQRSLLTDGQPLIFDITIIENNSKENGSDRE